MKIDQVWQQTPQPSSLKLKTVIYALDFSPDGMQLVVCAGKLVIVYDANTGRVIATCKGHNDLVFCVNYSLEGTRFVTGGADKTVIVWTNKCVGALKYGHNDKIQAVCFNPVSFQLASITSTDFGLWSSGQKSVPKFRLDAKGLCCAWTMDGSFLAIGMINGKICLSDSKGSIKVKITRQSQSPIWTLRFNRNILAVGCWDQTLSFYNLDGRQIFEDILLKYNPCSITFLSVETNDYVLISGSDKHVTLWTMNGIKLKTIASGQGWIWCVEQRPTQIDRIGDKFKYIAAGCNDGSIAIYRISLNSICEFYYDRFAYRSCLTDVTIQNFNQNKRVTIPEGSYVKKIALYRNRLAIELSNCVMIYAVQMDSVTNVEQYQPFVRILQEIECDFLFITSNHIVFVREQRLQLYSFNGLQVREWILEATVRFVKVLGGPPNCEGLLVGLKNGCCLMVFINNDFPTILYHHYESIKCLDLSCSRQKLALVDEGSYLCIYDLTSKKIEFESTDALSVSWNNEFENMLSFSGIDSLSIKSGSFPVQSQKIQGGSLKIAGCRRSQIFCFLNTTFHIIEVPLHDFFNHYLEIGDFENAYQIACFGIPDSEIKKLGLAALSSLNFEIAKKSFLKICDNKYTQLISRIDQQYRNIPKEYFLGEILIYQEKYEEAAKLYSRLGYKKAALENYLLLHDWYNAKILVEQIYKECENDGDILDLLEEQAAWFEAEGELKIASEILWYVKKFMPAINIMVDNNYFDLLIEKCRTLSVKEAKVLQICALHFIQHFFYDYAIEILIKLEDWNTLVFTYTKLNLWEKAFEVVSKHKEFESDFLLPYYENYLLSTSSIDVEPKYRNTLDQMIHELISCALSEKRYKDLGYYYWLLSSNTFKRLNDTSDEVSIKNFWNFLKLSEVYYAYHYIYDYLISPFSSIPSKFLAQISQFVYNSMCEFSHLNPSIHEGTVLFVLYKQALHLGNEPVANIVYSKLKLMHSTLPSNLQDLLISPASSSHGFDSQTNNELLPFCCHCNMVNPLLNPLGDKCVSCGKQFIRSFCSFGLLPLSPCNNSNSGKIFIQNFHFSQFYYRSISEASNDINITLCNYCNHFFYTDEFDIASLGNNGLCPFCHS